MPERMKVQAMVVERGRYVRFDFRWYVDGGPEMVSNRSIDWAPFMNNLTADQKALLQSINDDAVAWLKQECPELADAEDDG